MFNIKIKTDSTLEVDIKDLLTNEFLKNMGNSFIYHIRRAAEEDLKKQGQPTSGKPEGIPRDPKFLESFGFEIKPDKTIEIYSTWPWIDQIMEGRKPYPMKWLTKPSLPKASFKMGVVRTTPDFRKPWIHPGFKSHDFIQRGVEEGFKHIQANLSNQVKKIFERRI